MFCKILARKINSKVYYRYHNRHFQSVRSRLPRKSFPSFCYQNISRVEFGSLSAANIAFFENLLGKNGLITNPEEVEKYNIDWLRSQKGNSSLVLRPKTTDDVSKILSYCNEKNLAICTQGGNTGLVGGSIPVTDEIVLSTSLMNNIEYLDTTTGVMECQAGCVLENLEVYAAERNYTIPLDLGAKGTCHIGGNAATNAGGVRLVRYGSLHANILGLEVVLANGEVLDCMNTLRKDNTGYDLKHIFIGSEGTLGVITKVAILCYPKPSASAVAFLGCHSFQNVLLAVKIIKSMMQEVLSSLEMMDNQAADVIRENLRLNIPISPHPFYILIEISGSNSAHIEETLTNCLSTLMEQQIISNGIMATESSRIQAIWSLRERITEALLQEGCGYKYDISLPLPEFYNIVEVMREKLGDKVTRCCAYGHLGDGNVHFNVTTPTFDADVFNIIEPFIYQWVSERRGSISAEHGIGYKKKKYLHYSKTATAICLMKSFKGLLDPKGILNPYKLFS